MIGQTFLERYRVTEKIGEGSTSVIYKGHDTKEDRTVALKFPKEKIRTNEISSIMRFAQQMRPMVGVESSYVVNIYDVFQHQNFPVVVTEYVDGDSLSHYIKQQPSIDIDHMVEIMVDILEGLEFIHAKGIIHRDIKPSNIMLQKKEGKLIARITDFGLALLLDLAQLQQETRIAGTFSYMSPEQTGMLKKPMDFRSDIYSAGILFYQLLTKRLPFSAEDIPTLIHRHIAQMPTSPSVLNSQISPVLDKIILKMLAKDPQDRYQTEKGIMYDLEEYFSQRKQNKDAVDFEIGKRDRLTQLTYRSRLIGRKRELTFLHGLIDGLDKSRGNIVFIAGKAGSGKTRLVNELHSYAYTKGAFFASGKCYKTPYKTPYAVFKEALDDYIERIKRLPSNLRDEQISLMKNTLGELGGEIEKITPRIKELLGEQPKLVELEPQKEKIRFLITASHFLTHLATPQSPLIIFLDDLQWADESSLELLQEVIRKLHQSNILALSTYRVEEVEPSHPLTRLMINLQDQQLRYHLVNIKDLSEEDTNFVVSEILSEDPGKLEPLSAKIFSQTGGNPFFITEILHTLIDNDVIFFKEGHYVYDLSKMESLVLPDNVIDALISRIGTLTSETSHVLSYGAVVGKRFRIEDVLSLLSFMEPQQVLNSIEEAIDNQFLTRNVALQEEVLFVHDRVREAFYKKLPLEERVELNKKIAFSLEEHYKDDPETVIFDLAYHFLEAGVEDKTLIYSIQAGHKAKRSYAHVQAISLYEEAKGILERENRKETEEYIEVLENLGEVYRLAAKFDESLVALKQCESLILPSDTIHRTQILSKVGDTLFERGKIQESTEVLERALEILKVKSPKSQPGVILGIGKEFIRQMFHAWFPKIFVRKEYRSSLHDLIISRILNRLGHIYYFCDMNKSFYTLLKSLNISEKLGPCSELAYTYISSGNLWCTFPWFSRAFRDHTLGLKMAQELGDRIREGCGYSYIAFEVYLENKPRESIEYAQKSISILKGLGEYWDLGVAYVFRTHSDCITGRLKEGIQDADEMVDITREAKAVQPLGWALYDKGRLLAMIGDIDDTAMTVIKESYRMLKEGVSKADAVRGATLLAYGYLRREEYSEVIQPLNEAADLFSPEYRAPWTLDFLPWGAQIYLEMVLKAPGLSKEEKNKCLKRAGKLCRQALSFGKNYRFFIGWAYQVNGTYQWLMERKKKAIQFWEKGIKFLKEETEDKYRLGTILLEEGRFLINEKDPEMKDRAKRCLEEARQFLIESGAKQDLRNVNSLLGIKEEEGEEPTTALYEETTFTTTLAERERALSLTEATRLISSILDLDKLLGKIVELSIKASGAERGFLLLYNENTKKLELAVSFPQEKQTKTVDFSEMKISKTIISYVEQQKHGVIYPPIESQKEVIEKSESINIYGIRSILCSPFLTKDKLLGMLYLDNHLAEGVFEQKDLGTLNSICSQAAVSIENARLFKESQEKARLEQEMNTARQIQRSLLPQISPHVGDLSVEGLMLSAKEVAGDYFDYVNYGPERLGVVVADVSGKGMDSGMVMSMTKTTLITLSKQNLPPRELVVQLNKILFEQLQQQKFVSLIYAEYRSGDNSFTWGGGGHEHVIVYRAPQDSGGSVEVELIKTGGIVLGMFEDIDDKIPEKKTVINKGDKVILYTDGVTEARNPEEKMFTLEKLVDIIRKAPALSVKEFLSYLKEKVQQHIQDAPQYDDITMVVLGRD